MSRRTYLKLDLAYLFPFAVAIVVLNGGKHSKVFAYFEGMVEPCLKKIIPEGTDNGV